jgi:hypothetical protein
VLSLIVIAAVVGEVGGREALATKPRFVDNGDGTITDNVTRLQWEKKVNGSICVHCVDARYTWSDAMLSFISAVNNSALCDASDCPGPVTGLGGYTDWRLPDIAELQTIIGTSAAGCGSGGPCIDPIFGPTAMDNYWTSTTFAAGAANAWTVDFILGSVSGFGKDVALRVRAVRGSQ